MWAKQIDDHRQRSEDHRPRSEDHPQRSEEKEDHRPRSEDHRTRSEEKENRADMEQFRFGDVVMAQIEKYPFWPAVIDECPMGEKGRQIRGTLDKGSFVVMVNGGSIDHDEQVYVMFLSDAEERGHGWVNRAESLLPLCSREQFESLRSASMASPNNRKPYAFSIKPRFRQLWERGMVMAKRLVGEVAREDRIAMLDWRYCPIFKSIRLCLKSDAPLLSTVLTGVPVSTISTGPIVSTVSAGPIVSTVSTEVPISTVSTGPLVSTISTVVPLPVKAIARPPPTAAKKRSATPSISDDDQLDKRRRLSVGTERSLQLAYNSQVEKLRKTVVVQANEVKEQKTNNKKKMLAIEYDQSKRESPKSKTAVDMLHEQCHSLVDCMDDGPVCVSCYSPFEGNDERYKCTKCDQSTHVKCSTGKISKTNFICQPCRSRCCSICEKATDTKTTGQSKCSVKQCRRFYHPNCISRYSLGGYTHKSQPNGSFECPAHRCFTCYSYGRDQAAVVGTMMMCMRCPVTYHKRDMCIPAGAHLINSTLLLCPLHYEASNSSMKQAHVNIDLCFDCQKGGTLICCERCPAALHKECLGPSGSRLDIVDNEDFLCTECRLGRFPMFNDIVWVKYGHYKWWPSLVVHALQIPDSIERRPHSVGEFVVRFLGNGQQYAWVSHGRAFRYMDGDQHEKVEQSADRAYHRALLEAAELLALKKELCEIAENDEDGGGLPKRQWNDYKHIEHNIIGVGGRVNNQFDRSEYPICSCDPFKPNPCSSDSECSNRATQIECNEDCPAGEKCCNRRFAKCLYVETQPFDAGRKLGYGLRTMVDIPQGAFVIEYCGELIGKAEFKRRWQAKMECNDTGFYFLTLDRDRTIDAEPAGNYARFMNHSCRPNCSTFVWQVGNDIRVGLFACRKISAGENLTFHYNMDSLDAEGQIPCRCGEESCMGTIGKRQRLDQ